MSADPTPLQERLWEAVAEVRDQHPRVFNDAPTDDVIAAVLPIIAAEVRKGRAAALREAAEAMGEWGKEAVVVAGDAFDEDTWVETSVTEWLTARAADIEKED